MTDLERLELSVDALHRDTLFALADAAEEAGSSYLARGYRALANRKRWPVRVARLTVGAGQVVWEWWREKGGERSFGCCLEDVWISAMRARSPLTLRNAPSGYPTCHEALRAAAEAAADLLATADGPGARRQRLEEDMRARGEPVQRYLAEENTW